MNLGNLPGALGVLKAMPPSQSRADLLLEIIHQSNSAKNVEVTLQAAVALSNNILNSNKIASSEGINGSQELSQAIQTMYMERGFEKTLAFTQQDSIFTKEEKEMLLPILVPYFPLSELDNTRKMVEAITNQQKREVGYLSMIPLYIYQDQRQNAREMSRKITSVTTRISALQSLLNTNISPISVRLDASTASKKVKLSVAEAEAILEEMRQIGQNNNTDQTLALSSYANAITMTYQSYLNDKNFTSARKIALLHPDKNITMNHFQSILMQMTVFQEPSSIRNATKVDVLAIVKEMNGVAMQINKKQTYSQFDNQLGSTIDYYIRKKDYIFAQELMGFLFSPLARQQYIENMQREQQVIR
jgi:hypothetical protein